MRSVTTERFRKLFAQLPEEVRRQAREAYRFFQQNPYHPGLQFKRVHSGKAIYSVRVSLDCRVLGIREGDMMIWFWIGSHADYDRLLNRS